MKTKDIVLIALFTALITVGAFLRVPIPVVAFSFQTMFVLLAGLLLGPYKSIISVLCYIILGLIGLPIFTAGGGIFYVVHPNFGYLISFIVAAFVTGKIAWKTNKPSYLRLLIACLVGLFIILSIGALYYWLISDFYIKEPIGAGVLFLNLFALLLPGDIAQCFLAALVAKRLYPILLKNRDDKKKEEKS